MIKMIVITTMKELPERCACCPMNSDSYECKADEYLRKTRAWRPFWCPLKEIEEKGEK
jgi:hypothetical protein